MRVSQECYSHLTPKIAKTGRFTPHRLNKENSNQPDQHGRKSHNKITTLLDKDLNLAICNNQKDSNTQELVETIDKMQEYQNQCMKSLNLREAQETKEKMLELKRELITRKKKSLEEKYQNEIERSKQLHVKEMNAFNEFWDSTVSEFESEASNIETEMLAKHKEEHTKAAEELKIVVPLKKKTSPQYLNYKRTLETLVKKKEFIEAEHIKSLCDALEREERIKAFKEKEQRVKFFLNQLEQKHKNELNVLRKRISSGREALLKNKAIEFEKLLHKFQISKQHHDIDLQHELSKFEATHKSYFIAEGGRHGSKSNLRSMSRSGSRSGLRLPESSKMHISNLSLLSPANITLDRSPDFVSPTATTGKHKRSQTNGGSCFNMIEISLLIESSEIKTKRPSSALKNRDQ